MPTFKRLDIETADRAALIAHIDELEDILEALLPKDGDVVNFSAALGLTRQQAVLLAALSDGKVWSRDRLCAAAGAWKGRLQPDHVMILIHNIRRRLQTKGIVIETINRCGWRVRPDCLPALKAIRIDDRPPILCVPRSMRQTPNRSAPHAQ